MRVCDIMTKNVRTVRMDESTEPARWALQFWNYRHLPVIDDDDHVVGMVTPSDLLQVIDRRGTTDPVPISEAMHRPALTIGQDELIEVAVPRMNRAGVHALAVVDGADRLVGIVTDADVLAALASDRPRGID